MKIRVLGPRVLVRNYTLPEQIGSIIVPPNVLTQWDGKTFEVVLPGQRVAEELAIGGMRGDSVYPVMRDGIDGLPPLELEEDDIIILRHMFRGTWAGPEIRDYYGYDCWFIEAVETHGTYGRTCAIAEVRPSKAWKEAA